MANSLAKKTRRTLKQIESHITTCAESIQKNGLEIGRDLIEIRDNHLWAEEYESWNQYLKDRAADLVGKSFVQSARLIVAAEVTQRVPPSIIDDTKDFQATHFTELARLAPDDKSRKGTSKDYTKLRKQDVRRVLQEAKSIAGNGQVSVRDIRKAVDDELGIDRKAEAAKAKMKRERESQIDLDDYLSRIKGTSEGWQQVLEAVPVEAWDDYADLIDEAATALESLAAFLRE